MILKHKCRNSWDIKSISFEMFDRKKACSDDYIWLCTVCWFQNQVRIHNLWTFVSIKQFAAAIDNRLRSESSSISFPGFIFDYEFQIICEFLNWNAISFCSQMKISHWFTTQVYFCGKYIEAEGKSEVTELFSWVGIFIKVFIWP